MNNYESSKKVRRIASVIYLIVMAVIFTGTYLSNQQKELTQKMSKDSSQSFEDSAMSSDFQEKKWKWIVMFLAYSEKLFLNTGFWLAPRTLRI